jgi:hypothetical protein
VLCLDGLSTERHQQKWAVGSEAAEVPGSFYVVFEREILSMLGIAHEVVSLSIKRQNDEASQAPC